MGKAILFIWLVSCAWSQSICTIRATWELYSFVLAVVGKTPAAYRLWPPRPRLSVARSSPCSILHTPLCRNPCPLFVIASRASSACYFLDDNSNNRFVIVLFCLLFLFHVIFLCVFVFVFISVIGWKGQRLREREYGHFNIYHICRIIIIISTETCGKQQKASQQKRMEGAEVKALQKEREWVWPKEINKYGMNESHE